MRHPEYEMEEEEEEEEEKNRERWIGGYGAGEIRRGIAFNRVYACCSG